MTERSRFSRDIEAMVDRGFEGLRNEVTALAEAHHRLADANNVIQVCYAALENPTPEALSNALARVERYAKGDRS